MLDLTHFIKNYKWIENYSYLIMNYNLIIEKIINYLYNNYHIILIIYFLLLYIILIFLICSNEINEKYNSINKKNLFIDNNLTEKINILTDFIDEYKNNNIQSNNYDIIIIKNKEYFLIDNIVYKINKIKGDIYGIYNENTYQIKKIKK